MRNHPRKAEWDKACRRAKLKLRRANPAKYIDDPLGPGTYDLNDDRPVAYGYCRVSTKEQDAECKAQKDQIKRKYDNDLVKSHRWGGFYVDPAVSGRSNLTDRPGGFSLVNRVRKGDVIIVNKLDRISRSTLDFARLVHHLREIGASFLALDMGIDTSTPVGRMIANIMAALAEWETERRRERIMDGYAIARKLGYVHIRHVRLGFGQDSKGKLTGNLQEQLFMRQMYDWFRVEGISSNDINGYIIKSGQNYPRAQAPANWASRGKVYDLATRWIKEIANTEWDMTHDVYKYRPFPGRHSTSKLLNTDVPELTYSVLEKQYDADVARRTAELKDHSECMPTIESQPTQDDDHSEQSVA